MSNTIRNAVATRNETRTSLASVTQQMIPEIQRALPKHLDGDRMARLALTALRKDRNLAACTPASFAGAILTAASMGLEPGTPEAYLVPYKGECTLIVGYQGLVKLFWQSPLAKHIDAQAVHEHDDFDYELGLNPHLRHKPALGRDRGKIVAYYGVASLTTGASHFIVLTPDEIAELRATTRRSNIADPQHWMERKTVLRQLLKTLPRSSDLNRAISADEQPGTVLHRDLTTDTPAIDPATQEPGPDPQASPEPPADTVTGEVLDDTDPAAAEFAFPDGGQ